MKTLSLSLLALVLSTPAFACPVLHGTYAKSHSDGNSTTTIRIQLQTQAGSPNSYSLGEGMPLFPANGQPNRVSGDGQTGTIAVSCAGSQVTANIVVDGQGSFSFQYTKLSETQVQVSTDADPSMNGVYNRE